MDEMKKLQVRLNQLEEETQYLKDVLNRSKIPYNVMPWEHTAEKPKEISPACAFIKKIMADKTIVKGFICHSLWIAAPVKEAFA